MFNEWFKHYPRKVAIGSARTAYSNAILFKGATEEELLIAVKAYSTLCQGQDKQFIPKPCNWLNEERWHDEDIQILIEKQREKDQLTGWQKQISDKLGFVFFDTWCKGATFENGTLQVDKSWKAEQLKQKYWQALNSLGINEIRAIN